MSSMNIFCVEGPFKVPVYQGKAGRVITKYEASVFCSRNHSIVNKRGCYVFGIRAGKGMTPGYIGKTQNTFRDEIFTPHKLSLYAQFLVDYQKGTPVFFFLMSTNKKGAPNVRHIRELEDFLIQVGVAANGDLLNTKGTQQEEWGISGVLRSRPGHRSRASILFGQMMKL